MTPSCDNKDFQIAVGKMVRAPRSSRAGATAKPILCRAIVSTITNDNVATLMWEDPSPLLVGERFLVAPKIIDSDNEEDDPEVDVSTISPLLPFEISTTDNDTKNNYSILQLKNQGDELLRLRDPSAAIERYEGALYLSSSNIQVGGTVIINRNGYTTNVQVDCMEEAVDGNPAMLDVVTCEEGKEGEEFTIPSSRVLLALLPDISALNVDDAPHYDRIQERILLNLARCFLLLADTSHDRKRYYQASVLSCSLALSCATYYNLSNKDSMSTNSAEYECKARYLRATSYLSLGKFQHAISDVKYCLTRINNDETEQHKFRKLMKDIQASETAQKKQNKKLAKDVCSWVSQVTTTTNDSPTVVSSSTARRNETTEDNNTSPTAVEEVSHSSKGNFPIIHSAFLFFILSFLAIRWMILITEQK